MSLTVCLAPRDTLYYPRGGHLWAYLNWALGLRKLGCRVIWLDTVRDDASPDQITSLTTTLQDLLRPWGFGCSIAVSTGSGLSTSADDIPDVVALEEAVSADLLLNMHYDLAPKLVGRFRRAALVDIDPGLLQTWIALGDINVALHDAYFTIGEGVANGNAHIPDTGREWLHTPPCVDVDAWQPHQAHQHAAFTSVVHWWGSAWLRQTDGEKYENNKRAAYRRFLQLPTAVEAPMELALDVEPGGEDATMLKSYGWSVRCASKVALTLNDYRQYVAGSLGEFSCAKPSYVRMQTGWISDRTLCFLASGKPAIVQHTGPTSFLPDVGGVFRFHDPSDAGSYIAEAVARYDTHSRAARALAIEHFEAAAVAHGVLEKALT